MCSSDELWSCKAIIIKPPAFFVSGDATVTISHRYTPKEQLRQHTQIADIIIAAAGSNFNLLIKPSSNVHLMHVYRYGYHWVLLIETQIHKRCQLPSGIPNLITADMIKEGAAVIDVGINRILDPLTGKNRLVGDVDFEGKKEVQLVLLLV